MQELLQRLDPAKITYKDLTFYTYAIFDGVKHPTLHDALEEGILEYDMLFYEEKLRNALEEVAPYLVRLDFESETGRSQSETLLASQTEEIPIFLTTPLAFDETLQRVRDIFYVQNDDQETGYLRFYDPKIFQQMITQDDTVCYHLFKKIYAYWLVEERSDLRVIQYRYTPKGVEHVSLDLTDKKHDI